jgi:hypothetical protein
VLAETCSDEKILESSLGVGWENLEGGGQVSYQRSGADKDGKRGEGRVD